MPRLTPQRTALIAAVWLALTSGLHVLNLYGLRGYERQLQADLKVEIAPEPAAAAAASGPLPIFEASMASFEARRSLVTRMWSLWLVSAWLPVVGLVGLFIAANQRPQGEALRAGQQD